MARVVKIQGKNALPHGEPARCGRFPFAPASIALQEVAWLYDRVAAQLGVPLSQSYPCMRPDEA
jgi:hypothetical protein